MFFPLTARFWRWIRPASDWRLAHPSWREPCAPLRGRFLRAPHPWALSQLVAWGCFPVAWFWVERKETELEVINKVKDDYRYRTVIIIQSNVIIIISTIIAISTIIISCQSYWLKSIICHLQNHHNNIYCSSPCVHVWGSYDSNSAYCI